MLSEFQVPVYVAPWSYARDVLHCYPTWPRWEAESHPVGEPSDFYTGLAFRAAGGAKPETGSSTQTIIKAEVLRKRLVAPAGDGGERHDRESENPDDENTGGRHARGDDRRGTRLG